MANGNGKILTAEQEKKLLQPIEEYVGKIQKKIDALREDGTDKVIFLQNTIDATKRDKGLAAAEKESTIARLRGDLEKAKAVEAKNKDEVARLISDAEAYLKAHFDTEYYQPVKESCSQEKARAKTVYEEKVAQLKKEHQATVAKLSNHHEIKDEKYVHKNRLLMRK